jgi:hypothetical protein
MDKIKNNFLEIVFLALFMKSLINGTNLNDSIILISLVISIAYTHIIFKKGEVTNKEILENRISDLDEKLTNVISSISSLKIDRAFKRGTTDEEKTVRRY